MTVMPSQCRTVMAQFRTNVAHRMTGWANASFSGHRFVPVSEVTSESRSGSLVYGNAHTSSGLGYRVRTCESMADFDCGPTSEDKRSTEANDDDLLRH